MVSLYGSFEINFIYALTNIKIDHQKLLHKKSTFYTVQIGIQVTHVQDHRFS